MKPAPFNELNESNRQPQLFWQLCAKRLNGPKVDPIPGLTIAWAENPCTVYNAIFLSEPVPSTADFEHRVAAAVQFMQSRPLPGIFILSEDWLPESVRAMSESALAAHGLLPAIPLIGMAAAELQPPTRPLPE